MNILTDEEIKKVHDADLYLDFHDIARAIEAAVLSKLAEQAIEPTGYLYSDDPEVCAYPGSGYFHGEVPPNDAINIIPLFTEASLAAAQQRTAEACAKACEAVRAEDGDGQHRAWYAGIDMCIDSIRNGEWREYL